MTGANWTEFGGPSNDLLSGPVGIAFDATGRIYVVDAKNHRVVRFDDMQGTNWTTLKASPVDAGAGLSAFAGPQYIAFSPAGKMLVTDATNNSIIQVDDMTGAGWTAVQQLSNAASIAGVTTDAAGKIYFADYQNNTIYREDDLAGTGRVSFTKSVGSCAPGQIYAPTDMAIDATGRILFTDDKDVFRIDDMTGTNLVEIWGVQRRGRGRQHAQPAVGPGARRHRANLRRREREHRALRRHERDQLDDVWHRRIGDGELPAGDGARRSLTGRRSRSLATARDPHVPPPSVLAVALFHLLHDHRDRARVDLRPLHERRGPRDVVGVDGLEELLDASDRGELL